MKKDIINLEDYGIKLEKIEKVHFAPPVGH